ncbi:MAG: metallophosphoesterase [Verrucomicrobiae bacterium]|nr:metallophosphoesterase [Verrucomicrobiae bacterium]
MRFPWVRPGVCKIEKPLPLEAGGAVFAGLVVTVMRYLVVGDIHANEPALEAVLSAAGRLGVDGCLFVGDLVGYGPDPVACIERLRDWQRLGALWWVAGNHDLAVRTPHVPDGFIPEASVTLEWTRQALERAPDAREFLRVAPTLAHLDGVIWLTHDSVIAPGAGWYLSNSALRVKELLYLQQQGGRIAFYGHTHWMQADVINNGGRPEARPMRAHLGPGPDPAPLLLLPHETALIGVGSVGFPKNEGRRAEFLILDTSEGAIWALEKYAVEYPRHHTRARLHQALIPACAPQLVAQIAHWL